jgi:integrase/recombinase XerD
MHVRTNSWHSQLAATAQPTLQIRAVRRDLACPAAHAADVAYKALQRDLRVRAASVVWNPHAGSAVCINTAPNKSTLLLITLIRGRNLVPTLWRVKGRAATPNQTHLKEHNDLPNKLHNTNIMSQAKTITPAELEHVLGYIAQRSFAMRNRVMLLTGFWSGMRVGEIASLLVGHVRNTDGTIKAEIRLSAEQTKGKQPRTVFLPQKLRDELQTYLDLRGHVPPTNPLFITAGRRAFSANVMAQHFHYLFARAGIDGASSHSMRRSFITNLANKGISVRVLADIAGHRSIAVTQKYIDINDDMKRNAVEMI